MRVEEVFEISEFRGGVGVGLERGVDAWQSEEGEGCPCAAHHGFGAASNWAALSPQDPNCLALRDKQINRRDRRLAPRGTGSGGSWTSKAELAKLGLRRAAVRKPQGRTSRVRTVGNSSSIVRHSTQLQNRAGIAYTSCQTGVRPKEP